MDTGGHASTTHVDLVLEALLKARGSVGDAPIMQYFHRLEAQLDSVRTRADLLDEWLKAEKGIERVKGKEKREEDHEEAEEEKEKMEEEEQQEEQNEEEDADAEEEEEEEEDEEEEEEKDEEDGQVDEEEYNNELEKVRGQLEVVLVERRAEAKQHMELQERMKTMEDNLKEETNLHAHKQKEIDEVRGQLGRILAKNQAEAKQHAELQERMRTMEEALKEKTNLSSDLESELEVVQGQLEYVRTGWQAEARQHAELQGRMKTLEEALKEKTNVSIHLEKQLEEVSGQLGHVLDNNQVEAKQHAELQERMKTMEEALEEKTTLHAREKRELEEVRGKLGYILAKNQAEAQQQVELQERMKAMEGALKEKTNLNAGLQEQLEEVRGQLQRITTERDTCAETLVQTSVSLQSQEGIVAALETELLESLSEQLLSLPTWSISSTFFGSADDSGKKHLLENRIEELERKKMAVNAAQVAKAVKETAGCSLHRAENSTAKETAAPVEGKEATEAARTNMEKGSEEAEQHCEAEARRELEAQQMETDQKKRIEIRDDYRRALTEFKAAVDRRKVADSEAKRVMSVKAEKFYGILKLKEQGILKAETVCKAAKALKFQLHPDRTPAEIEPPNVPSGLAQSDAEAIQQELGFHSAPEKLIFGSCTPALHRVNEACEGLLSQCVKDVPRASDWSSTDMDFDAMVSSGLSKPVMGSERQIIKVAGPNPQGSIKAGEKHLYNLWYDNRQDVPGAPGENNYRYNLNGKTFVNCHIFLPTLDGSTRRAYLIREPYYEEGHSRRRWIRYPEGFVASSNSLGCTLKGIFKTLDDTYLGRAFDTSLESEGNGIYFTLRAGGTGSLAGGQASLC
eukprot:TRINITY_DN6856_c0_g1_i3.p1 TRINITY_DN6856_c0_g1~~TRINITY_DN6856_c0_g1_i3.p1  ORF type:complete len:873 (+),score=239.31 TRINITY_DN6856_c0_g1_i3:49-2619(+)